MALPWTSVFLAWVVAPWTSFFGITRAPRLKLTPLAFRVER
jgi:hypothetical protein